MEKILLVINANKPSLSSIDFACKIATLANTKLTGLFIDSVYQTYIPVEVTSYTAAAASKRVRTDLTQAIRLFTDECKIRSVDSDVYIDKGEPIQEAIYESRFADLIIVDPDIGFYGEEEELPTHLVKEILAKAECPVLLAPDHFDEIQNIFFCYDGSASSVFAIKQFTYLFPELKEKKATLFEISRTNQTEFNDSHRRMMDWLRLHYKIVCYESLEGNAREELVSRFFMQQNKLLVMGAFGRSFIKSFFVRSNAEDLIRSVDLPLFITHH
jgi:nucleotide-binding universal stress UspA family protein